MTLQQQITSTVPMGAVYIIWLLKRKYLTGVYGKVLAICNEKTNMSLWAGIDKTLYIEIFSHIASRIKGTEDIISFIKLDNTTFELSPLEVAVLLTSADCQWPL